MKLYLDLNSGISGDMFVSMLIDLGADINKLEKKLHTLDLDGYKIKIEDSQKNTIRGKKFNVILDEFCDENHEHINHRYEDIKNSNTSSHIHSDCKDKIDIKDIDCDNELKIDVHTHNHLDHEHSHNHNHDHKHQHIHSKHHSHRHLSDVENIINRADLTNRERLLALKIFRIIAEAEATAHGVDIDKVHFHEVGAVDSIVDIVAASICIEDIGIDEIIFDKLSIGNGVIKCQHGIIPIPTPAVVNISSKYHIPLKTTNENGEMVTPTGIAILSALYKGNNTMDTFIINKVGIGVGNRDFIRANILRGFLIEEKSNEEDIYLLETNIDDLTGEILGYTAEKLLKNNALDVWFSSIYMKKFRPAYKLSVICDEKNTQKIEKLIFKHTHTLGIRKTKINRLELKRNNSKKIIYDREVNIKNFYIDNKKYEKIEYDDIKKIADDLNIAIKDIEKELK